MPPLFLISAITLCLLASTVSAQGRRPNADEDHFPDYNRLEYSKPIPKEEEKPAPTPPVKPQPPMPVTNLPPPLEEPLPPAKFVPPPSDASEPEFDTEILKSMGKDAPPAEPTK